MSIISAHWVLSHSVMLQSFLGWGGQQAAGQAISEEANKGDVRLPAGAWQSGWWEGEDQRMVVLAGASGGT